MFFVVYARGRRLSHLVVRCWRHRVTGTAVGERGGTHPRRRRRRRRPMGGGTRRRTRPPRWRTPCTARGCRAKYPPARPGPAPCIHREEDQGQSASRARGKPRQRGERAGGARACGEPARAGRGAFISYQPRARRLRRRAANSAERRLTTRRPPGTGPARRLSRTGLLCSTRSRGVTAISHDAHAPSARSWHAR